MEEIVEAMSTDYLSSLLKTDVVSVKIEPGSNPGDNFLCVVYRVEAVLASGESLHFVLKAFPNHVARQALIEMTSIFVKEFVVYSFWFPTFMRLQKELGHAGAFNLQVPKFFDGAAHDKFATITKDADEVARDTRSKCMLENFLLMEDVRARNFRMADRARGLDAAHTKLVLKELAVFHALSWVFKCKRNIPRLLQKYPHLEDRMFSPKMLEQYKPIRDQSFGLTAKALEENLGVDSPVLNNFLEFTSRSEEERYWDWNSDKKGINLDQIESVLRVKTSNLKTHDKEPWLVAIHGDCWVNNFLFRYEERDSNSSNAKSTPLEVIMLDFQIFKEACPTQDLVYFFFTSTTAETRKAHMEEFLKTYYDSFFKVCHTLDTVPLPGFSMKNLRIRFRQSCFLGLLFAIPALNITLKDPETVENLDESGCSQNGFDELREGVSDSDGKNEVLKKRLMEIVVEAYENGVF